MSDSKKYNEANTIQKLAAGSAAAFDILYYKYYEPVRGNVFKIMRDEAITDDILQEVFISLWDKRKQFAEYKKISGWLFVASYNRSMNYLRRQATERVFKQPFDDDKEFVDEPGNESLQEQQFLLIEEAIAQLPPQRKKIFELCRLQGKTYDQTAFELSISRNTVKEHLAKATDFIRAYIQNHQGTSMVITSFTMMLITGELIYCKEIFLQSHPFGLLPCF